MDGSVAAALRTTQELTQRAQRHTENTEFFGINSFPPDHLIPHTVHISTSSTFFPVVSVSSVNSVSRLLAPLLPDVLKMSKAQSGPGSYTLYAIGCRYYFTPLTGVLFTFPSRYLFTIGRQGVFSLIQWSGRIHAEFHVHRITWDIL